MVLIGWLIKKILHILNTFTTFFICLLQIGKKMISKLFVYFIFLAASGLNLYSATAAADTAGYNSYSANRYGLFLGTGFNFHSTSFSDLPGVPNCCPEFSNGSGFGLNFGLLYEYRFDQKLSFLAKAGYYNDSGLLSKIEKEVISVDFMPYNGEFEHTIDATLSSLALKPMLGYYLYDTHNQNNDIFLSTLALFAGFRLGYLTTNNYSQKEEITNPADRGKFIDSDSRIRNESSGELPDVNEINFAISTALRAEFPLNREKTFSLSFEVGYDHQLTDFIDERDWTKSSLLANIGIIYTPLLYKETQIIALDTISPLPGASIRAVGVIDSVELPKATLKIEEILSEKIQPLLNYIFFAHSDAQIPQRYKLLDTTEVKDFSIGKLYDSGTLDTYYNLLNIIGKRMNEYPQANITITGCNSGQGFEKNDTDLSRKRSRSVADYLSNIWQIKSDRIKIAVRNLPEKPSNITKDDGIAENRRVEIDSDTWEIIAPVELFDTLKTATPPIIRFYPESIGIINPKKWVINVYQQRMVQKSLFGDIPVPESVDWYIDDDKRHMPKFDTPLYINFQMIDSDGNELISADTELPLEQITIAKKKENRVKDKKIDRFSLILFDFDKAEIDKNNERIANIINSQLLQSKKIIITGYTDRMGDDDYNQKLSLERANALANILDVEPDEIIGLGESVEIYDNTLPEGRFYSRTVEVIAETPVQW